MDAAVRYVRVAGGPPGREMLLVGLKSGAVVRVFVDNPFAATIAAHPAGIRCLDAGPDRDRVAVVDEAGRLAAYAVGPGCSGSGSGGSSGSGSSSMCTFSAEGANSVAYCADDGALLAYTGDGAQLTVVADGLPPLTMPMAGYVVGFKVG
jgi:intraflagellar transport protein 122